MASCVRCGKELPAFSWGGLSDTCRACRAEERAAPRPPRAPLPRATIAIIGVNAAVFAAMVAGGVAPLEPSSPDLIAWGADHGPRSLGDEPWRLVTSVFVHVGVLHLAVNMWVLWSLGALAEQLFRPLLFVPLYLLFGVAGSVAGNWWNPRAVSAGASGAVFGVAGLLIASLHLGHDERGRAALRRTIGSLVMFAAVNLLIGWAVPFVNNAAHLGGLAMGLACGAALARAGALWTDARPRGALVVGAAALLLLALAAAARLDHASVAAVERAGASYDRGAYRDVIALLTEAGGDVEDDALAQALLGASYAQLEQYAPARAAADRAVALDPDYVYARYLQGNIAVADGRYDEAITLLTETLRREPEHAAARASLGHALYKASRYEEAALELERAVRADGSDPFWHALLGASLAETGRFEEAAAALREALRLQPGEREWEALLAQVEAARRAQALRGAPGVK